MQSQYSQYLGQFKPLLTILGSKMATDTVEEHLNSIDTPLQQLSNIRKSEQLTLDYQRGVSNLSQEINQNGILKYYWIDKLQIHMPSVLIIAYDWTKSLGQMEQTSWESKLQEVQMDYWKYKNLLQGKKTACSTKIIILVFFGQNQTTSYGGNEVQGKLKEALDIDSKRLYFINGDYDSLSTSSRKLRKNIEEFQKSYYEQLMKKNKKKLISKPISNAQREKNIKYQIKISVLNEIMQRAVDKGFKHYETAYQCIREEIQANFKRAGQYLTAARKNNSSTTMNFDSFQINQKLQELRSLADIIMFRFITINITQNKYKEVFDVFEKHYKLYKNQVLCFDTRFNFVEYKWKGEIFKQFSYICFELIHQTDKILRSSDLLNRFFNIVIGSVLYGQQRVNSFRQYNKNLNIQEIKEFIVKEEGEVFFGRNNYEMVNAKSNVNIKKEIEKLLGQSLIQTLFQESTSNILSEHFTILNLLVELKNSLNKKQLIQIQFYLLKNYTLTENFDQFRIIADDLIQPILSDKMYDIYVYIIENYDNFLSIYSQDLKKRIDFNLNLILLKEESGEEKYQKFQKLCDLFGQDEQQISLNWEVTRSNKWFDIIIQYEKPSFYISEKLKYKCIIQFKQKQPHNCFDQMQIEFSDPNLNMQYNFSENDQKQLSISQSIVIDLEQDLLHNTDQKAQTSIILNKITLQKNIQSLVEKNIKFVVEKQNLIYKETGNMFYVNRKEPCLQMNFTHDNPIYVNELFNLEIQLLKIDAENSQEKIKNIQITLIRQNDQNKQFQMFYLPEGEIQKKIYQNTQLIQIEEFHNSQSEKQILFFMKSDSKFQEDLKVEIQYDLESNNQIKSRIHSQNLSLQFIEPFTLDQQWKVCSDSLLNQQCQTENAINFPEQTLPYNQLCSLKITIKPKLKNLWIKQLSFETEQKQNFQVVKSHQLANPVFIKEGDSYCVNLFIKTIKEVKNIPTGSISIGFNRIEQNKYEYEEINQYVQKLTNITVLEKNFQINIEAPIRIQLGDFFKMKYTIKNTQKKDAKLEIGITEQKDKKDFMVAGKTKQLLVIPPGKVFEYSFQVISLEAGQLKLPGVYTKSFLTRDSSVSIHDSSNTKSLVVLP